MGVAIFQIREFVILVIVPIFINYCYVTIDSCRRDWQSSFFDIVRTYIPSSCVRIRIG